MNELEAHLVLRCTFDPPGSAVDLAVSGGADSLGLLLLARAAGLVVTVHHVDHHARATSGADAAYVAQVCADLSVPLVGHDVSLAAGGNFEARARAARRAALPDGTLTGHTMDDLAETVLLNVLRGAGVDGLSPLVGSRTKPLLRLRRSEVAQLVREAGLVARHDETNDDLAFRRNRVRHDVVPLLNDVAQRDVVPLLARQAEVLRDDRSWLDALSLDDDGPLSSFDCRDLQRWPRARLTRWLRRHLSATDVTGDLHPPSAAEVARAVAVVDGDAVAAELSGGRRLTRRGQRLAFEGDSTTLTNHG